MSPYLIAFALPVALYPLRRKSRTAYVFLLAAAWSAFAGLRLDIGGNDYFAYRDFYVNAADLQVLRTHAWEPLFKLVAAGCRRIGLGYHGFLAIISLLGILPATYVIEKRSGDTPLGLFVYGVEWMFYGSFVILRQNAAMGMAFLAIDALLDRRYARYSLAAALAVGFHYSALILLVLPLFTRELKPRARTILFAAAGLVFLGLEAGTELGLFDSARLGRLGARLLVYFVGGGREPVNLLNVAEVAGLAFLARRYAGTSPAQLRNAYFLYVCLVVAGLQHAIILRFGLYFEISLAILIPAAVDPSGDRKRERTWLSILLAAYYLAKISRWLLTNAGGLGGFLPYRTFL